jgi:hypothetical protein
MTPSAADDVNRTGDGACHCGIPSEVTPSEGYAAFCLRPRLLRSYADEDDFNRTESGRSVGLVQALELGQLFAERVAGDVVVVEGHTEP